MPKQLTTEKFIEKSKKIHGDKFDYSEVVYNGIRNKIKIKCKKCNTINTQTPMDNLQGCGCRTCKYKNILKCGKDIVNIGNKIHKNKYAYPSINLHDKYKNSDVLIIKCDIHGNFNQSINSHLQGYGCKKCGIGKNKMSQNEFMEKAKKVHKNKYDYTQTKYDKSNLHLNIICPIHGMFKIIAGEHLNGSGCKKCADNNRKISIENFIKIVNKIHNNKYDYSKTIYTNIHTKINIICPIHGKFSITPASHIHSKVGCKKCKNGNSSKKEIEFLNKVGIPIDDRQIKINNYIVDGVKENVIYEFLGDYWHGNLNKFLADDINKVSNKTYKELHEKTFNRFNSLKQHGYCIKYIWENDWNDWCKDKTKPLPIKEY